MSDDAAHAAWRPFLEWADGLPGVDAPEASIITVPFAGYWDGQWNDGFGPGMITRDDRPGQPPGNFWWSSNQVEVSWYLDTYQSRWVPRSLFEESPGYLADVLFGASRHWFLESHFNKGLWDTPPDATERDRATSINPAAFDAAALLITASFQRETFPGVAGREPDRAAGTARARRIGEMMSLVHAITPGAGSYVNETDYFEPDWQDSFWGSNYPRLLEVKHAYDPDNLFRVHHGVGSDR